MRYLFTDGFNSMWHFLFGCLAVYIPLLVIPIFLIYQIRQGTPNDFIDVCEFAIGFCVLKLGLNARLIKR